MKTILLVDDDSISNMLNRQILKKILEDVHILTRLNGQEALELLQANYLTAERENDLVLILLDINMPVMDGFALLQELLRLGYQDWVSRKVVILSSSIDQNDLLTAQQFGVPHYLQKPLSSEKIKLLLDGR
jgi:CheY-like chemotaxis protein